MLGEGAIESSRPGLQPEREVVVSPHMGHSSNQDSARRPEEAASASLPEYERPPVVEVALGVQFQPIVKFRAPHVGLLWEEWRDDYPILDEVPPLDPTVEQEGPTPRTRFEITSLPPMMRYWFLSEDGSRLLQVQRDRIILNWRKVPTGPQIYPHYGTLREEFIRRLGQFVDFLLNHSLGELAMMQAELNYINSLPVGQGFERPGDLHRALRTLASVEQSSILSDPEEVRVSHVYRVDSEAGAPARCYVVLEPGLTPLEEQSFLLTLTVRGKPFGEGVPETTKFLDFGHDEIVRRFTEVTTEAMHVLWGRTR
jgi:uncharacterized protein (TIGR04255 family)